jgi:Zn ribbon nucleic-acid-binding protein
VCHKDIANDRESHKNLAFDECGDCHNYHDNAANYSESFIDKHLGVEATTLEHSKIPALQYTPRFNKKHISSALSWEQKELPATVDANQAKDWEGGSHAQAGVNCGACHKNNNATWVEKPNHQNCITCHKIQRTLKIRETERSEVMIFSPQ